MQSSRCLATSSIETSRVDCIFTSSFFWGETGLRRRLLRLLKIELLPACKISERLCGLFCTKVDYCKMRRKLWSTYSNLSKNTPSQPNSLTFIKVEAKEPMFASTVCISVYLLVNSWLRDSILCLSSLFVLASALF